MFPTIQAMVEVLAGLMSSMGVDKFSVSTDKIVYVDTMDETGDELT